MDCRAVLTKYRINPKINNSKQIGVLEGQDTVDSGHSKSMNYSDPKQNINIQIHEPVSSVSFV